MARRCPLRLLGWAAALAGVLALAFGAWLWHLPPTIPAGAEPIFEGVYYLRDVRTSPRLMVTHLVFIDLRAPGVGFLVTPGQPIDGRQIPARTTSQFLSEFHMQLAINGDGFAPFSEEGSSYYPHAGDPVDVTGFASSLGRAYSTGDGGEPTLYLSRRDGASFQPPLLGGAYNAISGFALIVLHGQPTPDALRSDDVHPRTAVALDRWHRTLILAVVDGRQTHLSLGATLDDLASVLVDYGADSALEMDGGGSSTLVIEGPDGQPEVLNSPIHLAQPGTERPVGNHLGVFADRLSSR